MEETPQGLFKMKSMAERTGSAAKLDSVTAITPEGGASNAKPNPNLLHVNNFNEYNCVGASSAKDANNESTMDRQQAHDQLSAQL